MIKERMQSPSISWMVPEGPYLWKVHLATFGKTELRGSFLFSGSFWLIDRTSLPENHTALNREHHANRTVVCEDSVKEDVKEEDLDDDIKKIQKFTNSKLKMF